jgi:Secretion system C-terminal sorting domain
MKKITLLLLFAFTATFSQKELWGVNNDQIEPFGAAYYGNITKYDINGQNPKKMHEFNISDGRNPTSKLFQASNGKIYGVTFNGGTNDLGVLYEYDLEINHYRVVHHFNITNGGPLTGVIEPLPGKLYGSNGNVYYYNINTAVLTYCTGITDNVTIYGELMKASNGNLYGTTISSTACQGNPPYYQQGTIFKVDLATNISQIVYRLNCNTYDGSAPVGGLIEASPGKLYGVTLGGGGFYNAGTLFEFDTATNVFTKKITFDENNLGALPYPLVNVGNGKLYGGCRNGGTNIFLNPNNGITSTTHNGTLFEYTPATNVINKLYDFGPINNNGTFADSGSNPISLMKTSNGYYMGTGENNPFKFDPSNNTVVNTINANIPFNTNRLLNFIEVCRKPSYQEFVVDTFDGCVGSTFTYDVQNTNATSYQWLKNNVNVIGQTTGILNLTNLNANDAGNYTCLMTNECGTTTTMVLHLTVSCLGTNTVASLEKGITMYPNPTKNVLNIKLPENIDVNVTSVTIANSLGQIVLKQKTENTTTINVSNLLKGIYIVSLSTNYGSWNGKFVKE